METREEIVAHVTEEAAERVAEARGCIDEWYWMGLLTSEEALREKGQEMEKGRRRAEERLRERGIRLTPDERRQLSRSMMAAAALALREADGQLIHSPAYNP